MIESKNRDKSKKRQVILEGAIDVFIQMGYELASMDKIAETAGVSKKTVYNHFGSKENLFQDIVDDFLSQRQTLKTIHFQAEKPLDQQLFAFALSEIYMIDSPKRLGLSRFLSGVFLKDIHYTRAMISKYPPAYDMLIHWIVDAVKAGKLKAENPVLAARVFYALINGAITWPALYSHRLDKAMMQPMLDELIATFLARYGSEG